MGIRPRRGKISPEKLDSIMNTNLTPYLQDILKAMSETGKTHYKKEKGKYVLY